VAFSPSSLLEDFSDLLGSPLQGHLAKVEGIGAKENGNASN